MPQGAAQETIGLREELERLRAAHAELARAHAELEMANATIQVQAEELRTSGDELREAEARAHRERLRYLEIFESAPDPYLLTDENGSIREANRAAEEL